MNLCAHTYTTSLAGIATFKLAETFKTTIGLDPSEGMISTARALASEKQSSGGRLVSFEVSTAEDISAELIPDGSVDLITAATCAHVSFCQIHDPPFLTSNPKILPRARMAFNSRCTNQNIKSYKLHYTCMQLITSD